MPDHESDDLAIGELVRDFPLVPARIISAVLAAYLRTAPTVADAAGAARDRIMDACAM